MDVAQRPEVFRRQRRVLRDGVRSGSARLFARYRRRLQGLKAGKPVAGPPGFRKTSQLILRTQPLLKIPCSGVVRIF